MDHPIDQFSFITSFPEYFHNAILLHFVTICLLLYDNRGGKSCVGNKLRRYEPQKPTPKTLNGDKFFYQVKNLLRRQIPIDETIVGT